VFRAPLPIDDALPRIIDVLREHGALVLTAPPGTGKTTRVAPALIESGLVRDRVLLLQPRRVAARAAARRMSIERGWTLGREVGYQVRFEKRVTDETRIQVVTEGILTAMLQQDPFLKGVDAVILDEFHLRSIHSDLGLALLQDLRRSIRSDLLLVVMSATLDAAPIASFLGACPVVEAAGTMYPLEICYRPRGAARPRQLCELVLSAIERACDGDDTDGDLLVFLPGKGEIAAVLQALAAKHRDLEVLPLHGDLSAEEQDRALDSRSGATSPRRRVVLATNVAETSVTIPMVRTVIDSGLVRVIRHDHGTGVDKLELTWISQASAAQRAGRAGRVGPGRVFRLWTEEQQRSLPTHLQAEIRRIDLMPVVLQLVAWGADPFSFSWLDAPDRGALLAAQNRLKLLGALDQGGGLTAIGRELASLPLHPRQARLLVEARNQGIGAFGALIAALLDERDPLRKDRESSHGPKDRIGRTSDRSDLLYRMELLQQLASARFRQRTARQLNLDLQVAQQILSVWQQLRALLGLPATEADVILNWPLPTEDQLEQLLISAYGDRVVRRRSSTDSRGQIVGGRGVILHESSVVQNAEYFIALRLGGHGPESTVYWANAIDPARLTTHELVLEDFDSSRQEVVARRQRLYADLCLSEERATPSSERAAALLADHAAKDIYAALTPGQAVLNLLYRIRGLARWMPELNLPNLDDDQLTAGLAELCYGRRSFGELQRADQRAWLLNMLSWEGRQQLERLAPERLTVPSGSSIALEYREGQSPILAVRLQEMFGASSTPTVAGGRVPVLLHLLAPNLRTVQVTQDLRSFWSTSYSEVRKELRRRYPKHAWPDDPATAPAERRPQRRR
jgi:ATP-dependent helicase HrpB